MTEWVRGQVAPEEMIRPEDVAEVVRCLLRLSPACIVPEVMMVRPGGLQLSGHRARSSEDLLSASRPAREGEACLARRCRPALALADRGLRVSLSFAHRGRDRVAVAVPAPERPQPGGSAAALRARGHVASAGRRRAAGRGAPSPRHAASSSRHRLASSWARSVRSSRSEALRARLPAPVKRSHARAKLEKSVRPPQRCAASIGQTPPLRSV